MIAFDLMETQDYTNKLIVNNINNRTGEQKLSPTSIHRRHVWGELDVLCGRGRVPKGLVGNRRFQQHIMESTQMYTNLRSKQEKSSLIRSIAHHLRHNIGFRFLKKKTNKRAYTFIKRQQLKSTNGASTSDFVELNEQEIYDKVGHSIRDLALKEYGSATIQRAAKYPSAEWDDECSNDEGSTISVSSLASCRSNPKASACDFPSEAHPTTSTSSMTENPILDKHAEQYLLALCDISNFDEESDPLPVTWNAVAKHGNGVM